MHRVNIGDLVKINFDPFEDNPPPPPPPPGNDDGPPPPPPEIEDEWPPKLPPPPKPEDKKDKDASSDDTSEKSDGKAEKGKLQIGDIVKNRVTGVEARVKNIFPDGSIEVEEIR